MVFLAFALLDEIEAGSIEARTGKKVKRRFDLRLTKKELEALQIGI